MTLTESVFITRVAETLLDEYSRDIERGQPSSIPEVRALTDAGLTACKAPIGQHLFVLCGAIVCTDTYKYRMHHHEFIVDRISTCGSMTTVYAQAEIFLECEDGNMMLGTFPTVIELKAPCTQNSIVSITYNTLPASVERLARWAPELSCALSAARSSVNINGSQSAISSLRIMESLLLPPVLTLVVNCEGVDEAERLVFDWAVTKSITRWNRALAGSHRILRVTRCTSPFILAEAIQLPIDGWSAGQCADTCSKANLSVSPRKCIKVLTSASPRHKSMPLSPEDVRNTIEHEIGHALGLADTFRTESLMSALPWNDDFPAPGAMEASSIRKAQAILKRHHSMLTTNTELQTSQSEQKLHRVVSRNDVGSVHHSNLRLSDLQASETPTLFIWRGERLMRKGLWRDAVWFFEQAAELLSDKTDADLRKHITIVIYSCDRAESLAAIEASLKERKHGWLCTGPVHLHRVLSFGYREMGRPAAAGYHLAESDRIEAANHWLANCRYAFSSRRIKYTYSVLHSTRRLLVCSVKAAKRYMEYAIESCRLTFGGNGSCGNHRLD